tara:strand:- start:5 stop:508 length:504 start_codon:yes stop_codon:yes gene_type:complete
MRLFFFILILFYKVALTNESFFCKTQKHNGLNYLGGEYGKILEYLGLKKFEISISRDRKQIYENEKSLLGANSSYIAKTSHFIELLILKSDGNFYAMNCSWLFNINNSSIKDGVFNCMEKSDKKAIFTLDYDLNFVYSSKFLKIQGRENTDVYHSLMGKCKKSERLK